MSRKPRVLNPPERIFLQVAGDYDGPDDTEYSHIRPDDITWNTEQIFDQDVEYRLVKRRTSRKGKANE